MLRRVAAFCRPLRPVLLLLLFPRSWSPVVGVLGLCWMWQDVPLARQWRPVVGVLGLCWLLWGSFDCFCCPVHNLCTSKHVEALRSCKAGRARWLAGLWLAHGA